MIYLFICTELDPKHSNKSVGRTFPKDPRTLWNSNFFIGPFRDCSSFTQSRHLVWEGLIVDWYSNSSSIILSLISGHLWLADKFTFSDLVKAL